MKENSKLVVLLGRASSGKTALIEELSKRGYNTVTESARIIYNLRKDCHGDDEIIKKQSLIYNLQLIMEEACEGLVFLDRSVVDGFAYAKMFCGGIPEYFDTNLCDSNRYHKVFSLEGLPFKKDEIRIESNEEEAQGIYDNVESFYKKCGYELTNVPRFSKNKEESIKMRTDFVLENI